MLKWEQEKEEVEVNEHTAHANYVHTRIFICLRYRLEWSRSRMEQNAKQLFWTSLPWIIGVAFWSRLHILPLGLAINRRRCCCCCRHRRSRPYSFHCICTTVQLSADRHQFNRSFLMPCAQLNARLLSRFIQKKMKTKTGNNTTIITRYVFNTM